VLTLSFLSLFLSLFLDSHVLCGNRRFEYIFSKGKTRLYSGMNEPTSSVEVAQRGGICGLGYKSMTQLST
jgi:hypothetical protein